MTDKITLGSIASFQNDATAVTQYNANNALITTALNNTLSRDGTSPNQLNAALDLNGNAILNGATTGLVAANIPFTPTGTLSSINVQTALAELDIKKVATSSISNVGFSGAGVDLITNAVAWTPTITFATPGDLNVIYSVRAGRYYQLSSNLVLVQFVATASTFTFTTASGNLQITGLPFTSLNVSGAIMRGALTWGGINKATYTNVVAAMSINTNIISFNATGMGVSVSAVSAADTPTGGLLNLAAEYIMFI